MLLPRLPCAVNFIYQRVGMFVGTVSASECGWRCSMFALDQGYENIELDVMQLTVYNIIFSDTSFMMLAMYLLIATLKDFIILSVEPIKSDP